MRDRLLDLVDRVDGAAAAARGVVDETVVAAAAEAARNARIRLAYPDRLVVAALAGGSGSGKSSLLNAVAGFEVADTGGVRPTTTAPAAVVPRGDLGVVTGYLDALEVVERAEHDGPDWLVLVDLPDSDSLVPAHRRQVDRILPNVDLVVFVVDPEKYRDAALHRGHVAPLADRADRLVFVLNQVDRLSQGDVARVRADLVQALREDGISQPQVVVTAASPVAGPPIGVEELLETIRRSVEGRMVVEERLLDDLRRAGAQLAGAGLHLAGLGFNGRWESARDEAARLAAEGDAASASARVHGFLGELVDEVGEPLAGELAGVGEDVGDSLRRGLEAEGAEPPPQPSLVDRVLGRRPRPPDPALAVAAALDERIGAPLRALLRRRAEAAGLLADLELALSRVEGPDEGN